MVWSIVGGIVLGLVCVTLLVAALILWALSPRREEANSLAVAETQEGVAESKESMLCRENIWHTSSATTSQPLVPDCPHARALQALTNMIIDGGDCIAINKEVCAQEKKPVAQKKSLSGSPVRSAHMRRPSRPIKGFEAHLKRMKKARQEGSKKGVLSC